MEELFKILEVLQVTELHIEGKSDADLVLDLRLNVDHVRKFVEKLKTQTPYPVQ